MKVLIVLALTLIGTKVSTAAGPVCTIDEADVIFVLDWSSSLSPNDLALQQEFAANVSSAFKVGPTDIRFGAVLFRFRETHDLFDLDTYSNHQDISQALLTAPFDYRSVGHPQTDAGLIRAKKMMYKARPTATKVVIVITESESAYI